MPLSGYLDTMGFADLVQWIAVSRKTGILVVKGSRSTRRILFNDGLVSAVASNDPAEHLGTFLVSWGYITEAELEELLERQGELHTMLGEILVRRGVLSRAELRRVLVVKAEDAFFDLMRWREGEFFFLEKARPRRDFEGLGIPVDHFLLEGLRQEDERRRFADVIPDATYVPSLTRVPDHTGEADDRHRVLDAVDGSRTVREVAAVCRLPEFDVLAVLFRAALEGLATVAPRAAAMSASPEYPAWRTALQEAANSLALGELREAYRHLQRMMGAPDADPVALEQARPLEEEIRAELDQTLVNGAPVATLAITLTELAGLGTQPGDAFVLSRIDGRHTVPQILSLLPGERLDNLFTLHDLLLRGLIHLER